jgi:hypothetical protein
MLEIMAGYAKVLEYLLDLDEDGFTGRARLDVKQLDMSRFI